MRILTIILAVGMALPPVRTQRAEAVSSWNPTLLVNTEAFQQIDSGDGTVQMELRFGASTQTLKFLTSSKFQFSHGLSVLGTMSGSALTVDRNATVGGTLTASGTIRTVGTVSGATLTFMNGTSYILGTLAIGRTAPKAKLDVLGTVSGSTLYASRAFSGAGLMTSADCDNAVSSKLLWDATTGRFSCGTDQGGSSGGGMSYSTAEGIFVNQGGDTMTGALQINVTGGGINTLGLRINNTASGAHLHAGQNLTSSGQLIVEGNLTFGDALGDAITANAATWTFANDTNFVLSGGVNALSFDTSTFSVDATANRIGIGTTAPKSTLDVVGTISGTSLQTSNGVSASGAVALESSLTGATLAGFGLTDCDTAATSKLLYDLTTKKFSCGADQGGGAGASLTRIAGSSGAAGADITWQNLTSNSADCTTTALCSAAMTTTAVGAGTWKFKYTLIYQTAATTTGIGFAVNHTGTAGQFQAMWTHITTGGAAATGIGDNDAATSAGQLAEGKHEGALNALIGSASAGVATANSDTLAVLEGIIVVTASGNLEFKIASEVASSAVRIMADSTLELVKIE